MFKCDLNIKKENWLMLRMLGSRVQANQKLKKGSFG